MTTPRVVCTCGVRTFIVSYHDATCPVHIAFVEGINASTEEQRVKTETLVDAVRRLSNERTR